jgi:prepilin-type N-terminal cleavage/methylation domain-containing protein
MISVRRNLSAFTLLEVIMALAIAGLLALVTVPFLFNAVDPVDTAAEDIRTLCRAVRSEALLSGEPGQMVVSPSGLAARGSERVAEVPEGWALEIRRTGETKFRKPLKDEVWEFNGEGICEPIVLRMAGAGRTYEIAFDPLTALEPPESLP